MKEAQMIQPNCLGHYHRDVREAVPFDRYYMLCTLSCGHQVKLTRQWFKKYRDSATLCVECSK